jgi:serine/threonine protein kinase
MYGNHLEADDDSPLVFDPKNDHLNLRKDPAIRKMIGNETFLFSDEIAKKNKFGFNQNRICIITDNSIYNFKNKKLKRRFEISKLKGITVSVAKGSQEFVIHGNQQEHDYLFLSKNKYIIIYIVEKVFEKLRGKQFDFIFTESSNLNNRMTTKKEKKENPKFSRMDDSELSDIKQFFKKLYYNKKGKLVYDRNYDPFDDDEKIPFIRVRDDNSNNILDYGNDYAMGSFSISRGNRGTTKRVRESVGGSIVIMPSDKRSLGPINTTVEENEEEEIEEDEEVDDDLIIKSADLSDFNFICCIGKGRNSITYIAKGEKTDAIYAIKVSDKEKLLFNEAVESLKTEKKILSSLISDITFVVQMLYCFQTFDKIFFVYPFYRGGDLLTHMEKNGGNFKNNEDLLFFYICQLIVFLNKIHEGKIIYRNLKPENIVLDDKGNIKIIDFSKSKMLTYDGEKGLSIVGAPEYMAPEIILGKGQSFEVDYWMLGILLYQLYYGYTPFEDDYVDRMYEKILCTKVKFDSTIDIKDDFKNLIQGLLIKDETKRLNDNTIKECEYFKNRIKDNEFWTKIENYEIDCPLKPTINEELPEDVQNFDTEFTDEKFNNDDIKSGDSLECIKSAYSYGTFNFFN